MRDATRAVAGGAARLWSKPERRLPLLGLVVGVGIAISAVVLRGHVSDITVVGYPGVFFLSFLGSVSMLLPVPGLISLCGVSVVLNPIVLALLASTGETIGELSGYAVGYGGGSVIEKRRFYPKLKGWRERRGTLVVFLVSIIPSPLFDLIGITAGAVKTPLIKFLAAAWAGKTIKSLIVAYSCSYGATLLPWIG